MAGCSSPTETNSPANGTNANTQGGLVGAAVFGTEEALWGWGRHSG